MQIFTENRKIKILKHCIKFILLIIVTFFIINTFIFKENFDIYKSLLSIAFGSIGVILSTFKSQVVFNDELKVLQTTTKHILGDYKQVNIPYKNLSLKVKTTNLIFFSFKTLKVLNTSNNYNLKLDLDSISNSSELIAKSKHIDSL